MIKRGVLLLIGILILMFNVSYVNGEFEGGCEGCIDDVDCNGGGDPPYEYVCRINDECGVGEVTCGDGSIECSQFGCITFSGDCRSSSSENGCFRIANFNMGYNREDCDNVYSCSGNTLNIDVRVPEYGGQYGWVCNPLRTITQDCSTLDICTEAEEKYGESCYCDAERKGCVVPTQFIPIQDVSGGNCDTNDLSSNNLNFLRDGYWWTFGLDGGNDMWWINEFNFIFEFLDGRVWFQAGMDANYFWQCNGDQPVILDLGSDYLIYAIRVYDYPNNFNLYYSLNQNNWIEIYNESTVNANNVHEEPYATEVIGRNDNNVWEYPQYIGDTDPSYDEYFLLRYNENPVQGESYLELPIKARYLKYLSSIGSEVVVEGRHCELEGVNHGNTCSDGLDNDCDFDIDGNDDDCVVNNEDELVLSLNTFNPNYICNGNSGNYRTNFRRVRGNLNMENVVVYDEVYNYDGQLQNTEIIYCMMGSICSGSYSLSLSAGNYYHNIYVENNGAEILRRNSYGSFTIYSSNNEFCCIPEGSIPGDGESCCSGMPTDGVNGACGCPSEFEWVAPRLGVEGYCRYRPGDCSGEGSHCTQGLPNWLQSDPSDDPDYCLRTSLPYEEACCFDRVYNNIPFYDFENIEVS